MKLLIRKLFRKIFITLINMLGLTLGIACFFFISLYNTYELSYDKSNSNFRNIYRVVEKRTLTENPRYFASVCPPIAGILKDEFPELTIARLMPYEINLSIGDKLYNEKRFYLTENEIFNIFDFTFIEGNKENALTNPNSVVLTEETAKKYFGNQTALGKNIRFKNVVTFTVTGVIKKIPVNSHFSIDLLASLNTFMNQQVLMNAWWKTNFYTYVFLPEKLNTKGFVEKIPSVIDKHLSDTNGNRIFSLQPLKSIHLKSHLENEIEVNGNIKYVYIFTLISVLVIIIACLNFINLSASTFIYESKVIALRKYFGAENKNLIIGNFAEPLLLTSIALIVAIILIELSMSLYNSFVPDMSVFYGTNRIKFYLFFILIAVAVGLFLGSYSGCYLSKLKPAEVFSNYRQPKEFKLSVSNALIAIQFVIAGIMISSSVILIKQTRFMKNMDLGFDKNNILVINVPNELSRRITYIKELFQKNTNVVKVSGSSGVPGSSEVSEFPYQLDNVNYSGNLPNILTFMVDYDFLDTYKIQLISGRNFIKNSETDKLESVIINEKAAKTFGWNDPINKNITLHQFDGKKMETKKALVIGLIKDFNFSTLNLAIEPLLLEISPGEMFYSTLSIKYKNTSEQELLKFASNTWKELTGNLNLEYYFLTENLDTQIGKQDNLRRLIYIFTIFIILLSCMGLSGIVAINIIQRSKEISIRKVMGSKIKNIVTLFFKQYIIILIISNLIAIPFSLIIKKQWFYFLPFNSKVSWSVFFFTFIVTTILTVSIVTYLVVKNAKSNPIDNLKYE